MAVLLNDKLIAVGVRKALVGGGLAFVSKPCEARRSQKKQISYLGWLAGLEGTDSQTDACGPVAPTHSTP